MTNLTTFTPCDQWQFREAARFAMNTYKRVPWHKTEWWQAMEQDLHLYAHVSLANTEQMAFTQSDAHGKTDRLTAMKPGKFLRKYADKYLAENIKSRGLTYLLKEDGTVLDQTISTLAVEFAAANEVYDVEFASTPEDIVQVYLDGPNSCMSHFLSFYESPLHPTYVYGAGDLSVAYLRRDDEITARVLCWPAKKEFLNTFYGDEGRLRPALENMGWDETYDFSGARLLKIPHGGEYVMPYLDGEQGIEDCGDHFEISGSYSAEMIADETHGLIGCGGSCDNCGEGRGTYTIAGEEWCESCYEDFSAYCEDCDANFHHDDVRYVDSVGGGVCTGCIDRFYGTCGLTDELHPRSNLVEAIDNYGDPIDAAISVLEDDDEYAHCEDDDTWYHVDEFPRSDDEDDDDAGDVGYVASPTVHDPRQTEMYLPDVRAAAPASDAYAITATQYRIQGGAS